MSDTRRRFEAWISAPPYEKSVERFTVDEAPWPKAYIDYQVHLAWDAWQAALADHHSGTVRVPVEPTHDLITAYMKDMRLTNRVNAICHYRAMLRAAAGKD